MSELTPSFFFCDFSTANCHSSPEEKLEWLKELQDAIDSEAQRRQTFLQVKLGAQVRLVLQAHCQDSRVANSSGLVCIGLYCLRGRMLLLEMAARILWARRLQFGFQTLVLPCANCAPENSLSLFVAIIAELVERLYVQCVQQKELLCTI